MALRLEWEARFLIEQVRLEATDESRSFIGQAFRALRKVNARIPAETQVDAAAYEVIAVGTPVWALGAAPAVRTWLERCRGMRGKRAIAFATYGSGLGKNACVDEMSRILRLRGARVLPAVLIQQNQCRNPDSMRKIWRESLHEF
jgi:NAD(P)H-dependent FMN reductase